MRVSDFENINDNHDWEFILSLLEDFDSVSKNNPYTNLKYRAAEYLDILHEEKLSRTEFRNLIAKH